MFLETGVAARGLQPADIGTVIRIHGHLDHARRPDALPMTAAPSLPASEHQVA
jgi:hypothetical protein